MKIYTGINNNGENSQLDNKLSQNDYNCVIDAKMSFGSFYWCGIDDAPLGYGYTLTNHNNGHTNFYKKQTYLLTLKIKMNECLYFNTNIINMYDNNNFLMAYNTENLKSEFCTTSIFNKELFETNIIIIFRSRSKEIYKIKFKISAPTLFGDQQDCSLCLQSFDDQEKYMTPCGHLFHTDCIFMYLETNDKLYPIYETCKGICCNTRKIKPFNCPNCNNEIIMYKSG